MSRHLPYDRADRVGTEIFHIIAQACHDHLSDPRVAGVQITRVKVSKDLRLARINYFIRGTQAQREACQEGLERAKGLLKRVVNEQLALKYAPDLVFHFDDSIERGERIDDLLREIHTK